MRPQLLSAAISALVLGSCYSPGDGQAPPLDSLYFPTGLTLDTVTKNGDDAPKYLYVASSDFDLQYRSSSLVSYDLDALRKAMPKSCTATDTSNCQDGVETCDATSTEQNNGIPSFFCVKADLKPCGELAERNNADRLLYPGRCASIDQKALIRDTVGIGAFATDVILRANPNLDASYAARLFLPVRGDATLHWIDLADGKFACGQSSNSDTSCDGLHRSGDVTADNNDNLRQPSEPFATDATLDGAYVAVTNQTTGSVSLFVNDWRADVGPKLASVLGGLPQAPVAIAAIPPPSKVLSGGVDAAPGFLVAYRNAAQVDLLRVRSDLADTGTSIPNGGGSYSRYALTETGSAPINANSLGFDSRDLVIDVEQRNKDYVACANAGRDNDPACFLAAHQPEIYIANRAPSSLLVGAMTADSGYSAGTSELPSFTDSVALTSGPSRVVLGHVKVPGSDNREANGSTYNLETRVFIVCFDSRRIFVYDPTRRVIDAIINTGRGPYALAIDDRRGLAYVAHFTDSYLGVVSLDQRFPQTYAAIVASIGEPSPPRSSK